MSQPVIVIHGGAGAVARRAMSAGQEQAYLAALTEIATAGQQSLAAGGSALDVVTEAVRQLEECPLFNAGKGAVFTAQGGHELDASVMDGQRRDAGAVCGVTRLRNPILAARAVLEHSPHLLFTGAGAEHFARQQGVEQVPADFFSTDARHQQLLRARAEGNRVVLDHDGAAQSPTQTENDPAKQQAPIDEDHKYGTVGAVACDRFGHLAAATSTGGMTNKQTGRVGDTPLIGAGCYADDATCAVSCTGTGEVFIRAVAAHDVAARMAYGGQSLEQAAHQVVFGTITSLGGSGGLIAVDAQGNVALPFNSEGMYRAVAVVGQPVSAGIYR